MSVKGGSAMTISPGDTSQARPGGARGKRSTRRVAPVVQAAKILGTEAAGDLAILNRNARRLNREARDVLSYQVPV